MCSMSIPNCVPQSPTWFSRSTEAPENSRHRHSASPITVLRRCPTCISLATFGLEKSTTARPQGGLGAHDGGSRAPGASPPRAASSTRRARNSGLTRTLMKPGPATEVSPMTSDSGSAARMPSATPRGPPWGRSPPAFFRRPNSGIASLHW